MEKLDILTLPLNTSSLIEASAGTGKTHTMANLYLRLLLGVGCEPLTVEQILVVTFTKAATGELRDRIRANIQKCHAFFKAQKAENRAEVGGDERYFRSLFQAVEAKNAYNEAILRLRIAEREMDLASVYTIHSFCQKMLTQFAFESGMRFDFELEPNESELLQKLSEQVWREQFYGLNLEKTQAVADTLKTPSDALDSVKHLLYFDLPTLPAEITNGIKEWQDDERFSQKAEAYKAFLAEVKAYWRTHRAEIIEPILVDIAKGDAKLRALNGNKYQKNSTENRIAELDAWSQNPFHSAFPEETFLRFCQVYLAGAIKKGCPFELNEHFVKNQAFLTAYQDNFAPMFNVQKTALEIIFLQALREKLAEYKNTHSEISFDDLLTFLNQALKAPQGKTLANHIRAQFPFAMIDEFQDTDLTQYEIFSQIFLAESAENAGFIMIGDPKQSIYKFRGADIFTYLKAADQAKEKRTLGVNWRSLKSVVHGVNQLFHFSENGENPPFLYEKIQFQPVLAKVEREEAIAENEQENTLVGEQSLMCYLQEKSDAELAAEQCAHQIQQQLKQAQAGQFGLKLAKNEKNDELQPFEAKDIAVLVRNRQEASLIKQALAKRQIKSVYFSERCSVYETETAKKLVYLLRACLMPNDERALLAVIGSSLWGLTAQEIFEQKNDEKRWDECVERFTQYQQIWQQKGVLPMLHQLYLKEGVIERLQGGDEADRIITNLLHLAELLQTAQENVENESALLRWYEHQITGENQRDENSLRLESEEELIKIVTIHGSKGLQYPIVWLPFIWKKSKGGESKSLEIYRNQSDEMQWAFSKEKDESKTQKQRAEFAEDLRLLYVALTRAESQINLMLPQKFPKGWNPMLYLLTNGEIGEKTDLEAPEDTETLLAQKKVDTKIVRLNADILFDDWTPTSQEKPTTVAREFQGEIRNDGQVTSFTALHNYHERGLENKGESPLADLARDYDAETSGEWIEEFDEDDSAYTPYRFPHSTKVGTILHSFWEKQNFQQAVEKSQISTMIEPLALDEAWLEPTQKWCEVVRQTPFGSAQIRLADIPNSHRLNEWGFYLRLKNETALKELNALLKAHHPLANQLPDLLLPQLEGYVRGFVDCIAQVNGQFYVIDYKSNFLGYRAEDYRAEKLKKAMGQYRYDLQYLLYTLAVHRYLKTRLEEAYDYDRDFGGVAYLFLRGMNGKADSGVYFDKPSKALIEGMDRLFG